MAAPAARRRGRVRNVRNREGPSDPSESESDYESTGTDQSDESNYEDSVNTMDRGANEGIMNWRNILTVVAIGVAILGAYCAWNPKVVHDTVTAMFPKEWVEKYHLKSPDSYNSATGKTAGPGMEKHNWLKGPSPDKRLKVFDLEEIKFKEGGIWYLVLVGHVFDVTGAEYYKPGSGYHAFVGQDASRSFITGEFTDDKVTDDLEGLDAKDYLGIADWLKFYLEHDSYTFVGYLNGKYFTKDRKETAAMARLREKMDWAQEESKKEGDLRKIFPSCNSEWRQETGARVWCGSKSGGIDRDWSGYPRKFFEKPDKEPRCACVHPNRLADPRVKEYPNCSPTSDECKLP